MKKIHFWKPAMFSETNCIYMHTVYQYSWLHANRSNVTNTYYSVPCLHLCFVMISREDTRHKYAVLLLWTTVCIRMEEVKTDRRGGNKVPRFFVRIKKIVRRSWDSSDFREIHENSWEVGGLLRGWNANWKFLNFMISFLRFCVLSELPHERIWTEFFIGTY